MAAIKQLASGKWQARIKRKGYKPVSKSFRTRKLADAWAREKEDEMERRVFVDSAKLENSTIENACTWYNAEVTPSIKEKCRQSQVDYTSEIFGKYTFHTLLPEYIVDYAVERLDEVKGGTVRKNLNLLKIIIDNYAAIHNIPILSNPVIQAKSILKIRGFNLSDKERDRRLENDEYHLLTTFNHQKHTLINDVVAFAVETAMRRGEISLMRRKHRTSTSTLYIPHTKTNVPREIPLSQLAINILDNLPVRIDGSFWGMEPDSITQAFCRMTSSLEIKGLVFHDLRHEGTSRLFELGLSIPEVAAITGHTDWKSLKRYTKLKPSNLAKKLRGS